MKSIGRLTSGVIILAVLLTGCTSLAPTKKVVTPAIEVPPAPKAEDSATATLIQVLDAAGCDFAGVRLSENLARKGSATLQIGCK